MRSGERLVQIVLHDIHARTVEALPILLRELKARGYRVVHVMPSAAGRPATVTAAADWRMRAPVLSAPIFALADVQDPDGELLMDKSAAELCSLRPPNRDRRIAKLRIEKPIVDRPATDGTSSTEKPREAKAKARDGKPAEAKDKDKNKETPSLLAILLGTGEDSKDKSRKDNDKKKVATAAPSLDIHGMR